MTETELQAIRERAEIVPLGSHDRIETITQAAADRHKLIAYIHAQAERIAELEGALRPFALAGEYWTRELSFGPVPADKQIIWGPNRATVPVLTAQNLVNARAAMDKSGG